MRAWPQVRRQRKARRRVGRDVGELTRAVADDRAARALARLALADLTLIEQPAPFDVASAVARRCDGDGQRALLAAYLHIVRDVSFDSLGHVLGVDPAAARRLVERGSGGAPVTTGQECRGWALVTPQPGRTAAERSAASGHLSLCRRCRNRLRAHAALERRVAVAGSATVGASVVAAIGRTLLGGHSASAAAGALTGPVAALSAAAALTTGVGAFAVSTHGGGHDGRPASHVRQDRSRPVSPDATPAAVSHQIGRPPSPTVRPPAAPVLPTRAPVTTPLPTTPRRLLPTAPSLPLPTVSPPPLPLPTVTLSPLPAPLPTVSLPVPLPTVSLLPLP
ncbi:MAG TPA: hypothetical protein VFJ98_01250 [Mycobacteriales bacterium]|nr:hypothetical protein [Mycobacteriales bacterium]